MRGRVVVLYVFFTWLSLLLASHVCFLSVPPVCRLSPPRLTAARLFAVCASLCARGSGVAGIAERLGESAGSRLCAAAAKQLAT